MGEIEWEVVSLHAWTIAGLYSVDTSSPTGRRGWHARFAPIAGGRCELLGIFSTLEEAQNACKRHAERWTIERKKSLTNS